MFNQNDLIRYYGLKKVIENGSFDIKGEAVIAAASFFSWFNNLENIIRNNQGDKKVEEKPVKKSFKPLGAPKPAKADK